MRTPSYRWREAASLGLAGKPVEWVADGECANLPPSGPDTPKCHLPYCDVHGEANRREHERLLASSRWLRFKEWFA
jgi:hypothetical protein